MLNEMQNTASLPRGFMLSGLERNSIGKKSEFQGMLGKYKCQRGLVYIYIYRRAITKKNIY